MVNSGTSQHRGATVVPRQLAPCSGSPCLANPFAALSVDATESTARRRVDREPGGGVIEARLRRWHANAMPAGPRLGGGLTVAVSRPARASRSPRRNDPRGAGTAWANGGSTRRRTMSTLRRDPHAARVRQPGQVTRSTSALDRPCDQHRHGTITARSTRRQRLPIDKPARYWRLFLRDGTMSSPTAHADVTSPSAAGDDLLEGARSDHRRRSILAGRR